MNEHCFLSINQSVSVHTQDASESYTPVRVFDECMSSLWLTVFFFYMCPISLMMIKCFFCLFRYCQIIIIFCYIDYDHAFHLMLNSCLLNALKHMAMGKASFCVSFIIISILDSDKHSESCSYISASPVQMCLG